MGENLDFGKTLNCGKLKNLNLRNELSDENRLNETENIVSKILFQVKNGEDSEIEKVSIKLGEQSKAPFKPSEDEWEFSNFIERKTKNAIKKAIENITAYHKIQIPEPRSIEYTKGVVTGQIYRPINKVGIYVPGGSSPLISSLLMGVIPAKLAGCKEIIVVTPPGRDNKASPVLLYACRELGIKSVFKIGGAQAIGALAFGTSSVPKVDKIFGPGNAYTAEAKRQVSLGPNGCDIDFEAGPSEILVIADSSSNPRFVASDLLSQLEHGPDSQAVLLSSDLNLIEKVKKEITNLCNKQIPFEGKNLVFGLCKDIVQALEISNQYAPEHLSLQMENPKKYLEYIESCGSIFIGPYSPEALGDYCSGPNHVLPTYGKAKTTSGLGVMDFLKRISVQEVSKNGIQELADTGMELARIENLPFHSLAMEIRKEN